MKQPEKETLILWVQGELEGNILHEVEAWADENPALASSMVTELETPFDALASMPASLEPPHADFLNTKIRQQLEREQQSVKAPLTEVRSASLFERLKWVLAPTALAAMVVCFFLGTQFGTKELSNSGAVAINPTDEPHLVYVPNESVKVEVYSSDGASMIVLDGLEPISDNDASMVSYEKPDPGNSVRLISSERRMKEWH